MCFTAQIIGGLPGFNSIFIILNVSYLNMKSKAHMMPEITTVLPEFILFDQGNGRVWINDSFFINQIKHAESSRRTGKILKYLCVGPLPELSSFSVLYDDYYGICTGKNSVRVADRIMYTLLQLRLLMYFTRDILATGLLQSVYSYWFQ